MTFAAWYILLFVPLCFLCFKLWAEYRKPPSIPYSIPIPASLHTRNPLPILVGLRMSALICLLIALARPQNVTRITHKNLNGVDIIMLLDVSISMNIEDLAEHSRLTEAKSTIQKFILGRQNDRIGLVIFSGEPLTLAPPTLDYQLVLQSLDQVSSGILRDGTAIGDGLALAVSRLKDSQAKSKVIILLTDGDNNLGKIDPATAGELAAGYGIRVYTIAIGKEGRVRMPVTRPGFFGNTVRTYTWVESVLNPEILKKIAADTKGKFYRVTDANTLKEVFQEIDSLEKTKIDTQQKVLHEDLFDTPLKVALLLLLLEQALAMSIWRFFP